jgi:nucleoid DNA-binding protein
MTRRDLIEYLADCAGISRAQAKRALSCLEDGIIEGVRAREDVHTGLGIFKVRAKPPRPARGPRTGRAIRVPEDFAVSFKPSKSFRESLTISGAVRRGR